MGFFLINNNNYKQLYLIAFFYCPMWLFPFHHDIKLTFLCFQFWRLYIYECFALVLKAFHIILGFSIKIHLQYRKQPVLRSICASIAWSMMFMFMFTCGMNFWTHHFSILSVLHMCAFSLCAVLYFGLEFGPVAKFEGPAFADCPHF